MFKKEVKMNEVVDTIFQEGSSLSIKNLRPRLRIWAKIGLRCIYHRPAGNYADYINSDQKYMLYYLAKRVKMKLHYILFKYLREMVKETRNLG